ncbi:MAG: MgtC/SapB family protein [Woeseiaceae bacterium]|nr:MgtC/SapB family protein [Woeseiaceae bacterium]
MIDDLQWSYQLAVALAIGLLVGIERGWDRREAEEGQRTAGVRTFGLMGMSVAWQGWSALRRTDSGQSDVYWRGRISVSDCTPWMCASTATWEPRPKLRP